MHYPVFDIQNDGIDWFWQADSGTKDLQIRAGRTSLDPETLSDYQLLDKSVEGRYLLLEKASGYMAIAELALTFAEIGIVHTVHS